MASFDVASYRDLTMVVRRDGDTYSISCGGEFDVTGAERFRHEVEHAVGLRPRSLEVSCANVTFIDSMGIRALLYADRLCRENSVDYRLTLNRNTRRLFDTLGLSSRGTGTAVGRSPARRSRY
jgi:anti-anti-sigma factor